MNIIQGKNEYKNMPLPENLDNIVKNSLSKSLNEKPAIWNRHKVLFRISSIAISTIILFIVSLNLNQEWAIAASKVPVLGHFVEVVTWQSYEEDDEVSVLSVKVPKLESEELDNLNNRINNEIRMKISKLIEDAKKRAEEYKEAFILTGGKEEEWHQLEINVDYDVRCNSNNILSFVIEKSESYASLYTEKLYYNIDLETGKDLKLSDLLGPSYIERTNEIIINSINDRVKKGDMFFGYGDNEWTSEKFTSITENTKFYINDNEKVVIVFDKYEIAPGYMGFVEFTIE